MTAPRWLDLAEYPFTSKWLTLSSGRLHYVDEGQGRPLVFVHGTPDWSFLWRGLIKALAVDKMEGSGTKEKGVDIIMHGLLIAAKLSF